jgi:hypothetical protein
MGGDDSNQDYQDGFDRLRVPDIRNWSHWKPLRPLVLKRWERMLYWALLPCAVALIGLNIASPKGHGWIVFSIFWTVGIVLALVRDVRAQRILRRNGNVVHRRPGRSPSAR